MSQCGQSCQQTGSGSIRQGACLLASLSTSLRNRGETESSEARNLCREVSTLLACFGIWPPLGSSCRSSLALHHVPWACLSVQCYWNQLCIFILAYFLLENFKTPTHGTQGKENLWLVYKWYKRKRPAEMCQMKYAVKQVNNHGILFSSEHSFSNKTYDSFSDVRYINRKKTLKFKLTC